MYTSRDEPEIGPDEEPSTANELPMMDSIRVKAVRSSDTMHPKARVNFAKIFTVEHNVRVYDFGNVHRDDLYLLKHNFTTVWNMEKIPEDDDDGDDDGTERRRGESKGSSSKHKDSSKGKRRRH